MTDFDEFLAPLIHARRATICDRLDFVTDHIAAGDYEPRDYAAELAALHREKGALERFIVPDTMVASIQSIDATGAIGPIEDDGDVIEICAPAATIGDSIVAVLNRFPDVECFDVTVTRKAGE